MKKIMIILLTSFVVLALIYFIASFLNYNFGVIILLCTLASLLFVLPKNDRSWMAPSVFENRAEQASTLRNAILENDLDFQRKALIFFVPFYLYTIYYLFTV